MQTAVMAIVGVALALGAKTGRRSRGTPVALRPWREFPTTNAHIIAVADTEVEYTRTLGREGLPFAQLFPREMWGLRPATLTCSTAWEREETAFARVACCVRLWFPW